MKIDITIYQLLIRKRKVLFGVKKRERENAKVFVFGRGSTY